MKINKVLRKRDVWTIALYKLKCEDDIFKIDEHEPFHYLGERGIRRNNKYQATMADPFLYAHNDRLYLFYEIQTDFGFGEIWAQSMDEQGDWINHGQVLKEPHHLSYPQVFSHDGHIWMIPEAAESGKVWLYVSDMFPFKWRKLRVLIDEPLVDSSIIIKNDGLYLLGTSRSDELKLYFATDIYSEFIFTGVVISKDRSVSRNAGRAFSINNIYYRVAQNCQYAYGKNISLLKIERLFCNEYREVMAISDLYKTKPKWMESGSHHISTMLFKDKLFAAVDGKRNDKYINTLMLALVKIFSGFRHLIQIE